ncbi:MAG TPA: hypothetical protein VL371_24075, partial [Gemmataceae bacterium]|nr:hypothetical protein [Gemmataceae bacterium]
DLDAAAGDVQAKLRSADQWWYLSRDAAKRERSRYRERAAHWYKQALPDLSGEDRTRAEERIQRIG